MVNDVTSQSGGRARLARLVAPFDGNAPAHVRIPLIQLQFERLHGLAPLLCLTIIANTAAMALAVMGELPVWQQLIPPAILIGVCLWNLVKWRPQRASITPEAGYHSLQKVVFVAGGLGLVSGVWTVNAFRETEQYYCVVAPVFLALSALVSANCLASVPRAATAAMACALAPIVIRMLVFDNLGIRTMAVMLVLIAALQHRLVQAKFHETVKMLTLQHEIVQLAEADALTGLKNRRAFTASLEAHLDTGTPMTVAMIDLDGFKAANDTHGHHAGDAVLVEVAQRMTTVAVSALCIARLGGDEFALVFDGSVSEAQAAREAEAVRAVIGLPYTVGDAMITISASIGVASSPADGTDLSALMQVADRALYTEKRQRRSKGKQAMATRHETAAA